MVVEGRRCHRGMNAELILPHPYPCIPPEYMHFVPICALFRQAPTNPKPPLLLHMPLLSNTHSILVTYLVRSTRYDIRETLDRWKLTIFGSLLHPLEVGKLLNLR